MLVLPLSDPALKDSQVKVLLLLATNQAVVLQSNFLRSDTSLVHMSPGNTNPLLLAVSSNCRSTPTTANYNTLATQLRLMARQPRCITNVITPSYPPPLQIMLTY